MPSWHPTATHFTALSDLLTAPERRRALLGPDPATVPPEVTDFLARLSLLQGVPFNYLVPDPRMLPEESIRFFLVDPNWLNALQDGALSIGRVTDDDQAQDQAVAAVVRNTAAGQAASLRPTFGRPLVTTAAANTLSGFLLRSAVVAGWPGLEVDAYSNASDESPRLDILRMERLSSTLLLGIFNGVFQRLDLHEPSEGIQFGADFDPEASPVSGEVYTKPRLRGLGFNGQTQPQPGAAVPVPKIAVPMRDTTHRVVRLAEFAAALPWHLQNDPPRTTPPAPPIQTPAVLTAAEFAVEMLEGPTRQMFVNSGSAGSARVLSALVTAQRGPAQERAHLASYLFGVNDAQPSA